MPQGGAQQDSDRYGDRAPLALYRNQTQLDAGAISPFSMACTKVAC